MAKLFWHRLTWIAVAVLAVPAIVRAQDPPKVTRFYPPGGQVGTSVTAEITGTPGDRPLRVWTDRDELRIDIADDNRSATITIPGRARPGLHWLRFYNEFGTTEPRPFIVGVVPEVSDEEPNNLPQEATVLSSPAVTVNGVLQNTGDVDIYKVDVPAGRTLVASLAANQQLGSPMDAVLQLLDANGTVIDQNDDDHGFDPQIVFAAPTDGTWYLRIFAFPSTPNSTIRMAGGADYVYRLTVTSGPFVDHTLPAVVSRRGSADVTICGWNLKDDARRLAVPWTDTSEILLLEDFAMPHGIAVTDHASDRESDESRVLNTDSSLTGRIAQPGESDVYSLSAKPGQQLQISVAARGLHSLLDPVVTVTSSAGEVLAEADDRSQADLDGEVTVTVPDDQPLTVTVTDRFAHGGFRHFYVLTCRPVRPEFTATVGATHYNLAAESPLEIPVTIARKSGFAEPLTIRIDGLPRGVTAEPAVSQPEGDSAAAVTLKLNRDAAADAFSGVIQVVCEGTDSPAQHAVASISGSSDTMPELWLTVRPPPPAATE